MKQLSKEMKLYRGRNYLFTTPLEKKPIIVKYTKAYLDLLSVDIITVRGYTHINISKQYLKHLTRGLNNNSVENMLKSLYRNSICIKAC